MDIKNRNNHHHHKNNKNYNLIPTTIYKDDYSSALLFVWQGKLILEQF